jgi:hypothetical protein
LFFCSSGFSFSSFLIGIVFVAFPFYFFYFLFRLHLFVSRPEVHWRARYGREAEVPFLSLLVSPQSTTQAAAKNLWPTGLSPQAEAKIQSAMADQAPRLFPWFLFAAKATVRDTSRLQAPLPSAASRLRAAQRGFRPKMAPAVEIGAGKSHKP